MKWNLESHLFQLNGVDIILVSRLDQFRAVTVAVGGYFGSAIHVEDEEGVDGRCCCCKGGMLQINQRGVKRIEGKKIDSVEKMVPL